MKKTRFTETQIVSILQQQEAGKSTKDVCREYGISAATFVTDLFASMNSREAFVVNAVAANRIYYDRLQEISLDFKYSLGRLTESAFRNKDVDENSNRIR